MASPPELEVPKDPFEQFVYSVSHDLQEPVRLIMSFQKLFREKYADQVPEEGAQYLEYAFTNAQKLQDMIRALVDFSRVSRNNEEIMEIDLNGLLSDFRQSYTGEIERRGATFEVADLPKVKGQGSLIASLFHQLVENAFRHTGDGPVRVEIGRRTTDTHHEFWVADNGPGIYPPYQAQVFHIFKKAGSKGPGAGAGLAIAEAIVQKHGGTIWLNTETETGTRIHFTLPL